MVLRVSCPGGSNWVTGPHKSLLEFIPPSVPTATATPAPAATPAPVKPVPTVRSHHHIAEEVTYVGDPLI